MSKRWLIFVATVFGLGVGFFAGACATPVSAASPLDVWKDPNRPVVCYYLNHRALSCVHVAGP